MTISVWEERPPRVSITSPWPTSSRRGRYSRKKPRKTSSSTRYPLLPAWSSVALISESLPRIWCSTAEILAFSIVDLSWPALTLVMSRRRRRSGEAPCYTSACNCFIKSWLRLLASSISSFIIGFKWGLSISLICLLNHSKARSSASSS